MREKSSHNETFEKLVKSKKDVVGMLAYCIYKSELQAHLKEGKPKQSFLDVNLNRRAWDRYRKTGEELLANLTICFVRLHGKSKKANLRPN